MRDLISRSLPNHSITVHLDSNLYIADYKEQDNRNRLPLAERRGVVISNTILVDIQSIHITNENTIEICFDGFEENALPTGIVGTYNPQCECVLFPENYIPDSWSLFIETKYADNEALAFDPKHDYPNRMMNQIKATVEYFRKKRIIGQGQRVDAIISFPNLLDGYSEELFRRAQESIEEILENYNIKVRATNSARVISNKRIKI